MIFIEKLKQACSDYTCVMAFDCSALSGRRHFDDVIKITGGISGMWAELLHFTGV